MTIWKTEIFLLFRKRFKSKTGSAQFKFMVISVIFSVFEVNWGQFQANFDENRPFSAPIKPIFGILAFLMISMRSMIIFNFSKECSLCSRTCPRMFNNIWMKSIFGIGIHFVSISWLVTDVFILQWWNFGKDIISLKDLKLRLKCSWHIAIFLKSTTKL